MDAFFRALAIYVFLLVLFRISGKRTFTEMTTFDFLLLLIIAEATQQGLLGNDFSVTTALLVVTTLIGLDIAASVLKQRFPVLDRTMESLPLVLVEHGEPLEDRLRRERVDVSDVLAEARTKLGLERIEQIKYAVLERSGGISIIPEDLGAHRRDVLP